MKRCYHFIGALFALFAVFRLDAQTVQTFTSNGTFTVPAGVTQITVECWGGGGGGGRSTSNNTGRGGGGGGAYARSILTVNPNDVFSFSVGTGGSGGNLSAIDNSGGPSDFGGGLVVAVGGEGVANNSNTPGAGGLDASCTFNDVAFSGGNGVAGSSGNSGAGGGGAGNTANGGNGSAQTGGIGGLNDGGNGGNGRTNAGAGFAGNTFGGGGGGGRKGGFLSSNQNGGAGASGAIRITYTLPACSGIPTAGTITPSSTNVITVEGFTLNLDGFSLLQGISFQWQSSTSSSGPFTDIPGATNSSYNNPSGISTTTYYQVVVTCDNTSESAISSQAVVNFYPTLLVAGQGANNVPCGENRFLQDHNGNSNYANNRNDWSVLNAGDGGVININGTYATESGWDFVRIYNGVGTGGALLLNVSGSGNINFTGNPGQTLTLQFVSDGSNVAAGFNLFVTYSGACVIPCTAAPNDGTIAGPTTGCAGQSITYTASNLSVGSTITYQWQSSLNNVDFFDIIGQTGSTLTNASVLGTTYYRLKSTCTSTSEESFSNVISYLGYNCNPLNITNGSTTILPCGSNTLLYDNGGPGGNYVNNFNGYVAFEATGNAVISINGSYITESGWDFVRIYNGVGTGGTLLLNVSGTGNINFTGNPGQTLTLQFTSDGSNVAAGIALQVTYSGICAPVAPTGITATSLTVCPDQSTTLTATGVLGDVYWFEGACGTSGEIQIGNNLIVSPTVQTTYYARNFENGFFSGTCASITIGVNSAPSNLSISGTDLTCASNSVDLSASATPAQVVGSSSVTYSLGNGNVDFGFQSLPGQSSCPLPLSVPVPAGATIIGTDVQYSVEARCITTFIVCLDEAYMSEQRSQLRCVSPGGANEPQIYNGVGNSLGTFDYNRTNLDIANNVVSTGAVDFELHVGRTYSGSGCNQTAQRVLNNTYTVTVYYLLDAPIDYAWSGPNIVSGQNEANATVNPAATSTYTVTATSNGCSISEDFEVTVEAFEDVDVQEAYNYYTWIDGITYTASNNTAQAIAPGIGPNDCDVLLTLDLTITYENVPSNDIPCNAMNLTSSGQASLNTYAFFADMTCNNQSGYNEFANTDVIGSACDGSLGRSLWYTFTTPMCDVNGAVPFEIELSTNNPGTDFNTKLYLFSSASNNCAALTQMACNDDNNGTGYPALCGAGGATASTIVSSALLPNTQYWVKVDGLTMSDVGNFVLSGRAIAPAHGVATAGNGTQIELNTGDMGAALYTYYYKLVGSTGYSTSNSQTELSDIRTLASGNDYITQVMYRCDANFFNQSQWYRTEPQTISLELTCAVVTDMTCTFNGPNSYTLTWTEPSGELFTNNGALSGYRIKRNPVGSTGVFTFSNPAVVCVDGTCSVTLPGNSPTGFNWTIETRCTANNVQVGNTSTCGPQAPEFAGNNDSDNNIDRVSNHVFSFVNAEAGIEFVDVQMHDAYADFGLDTPMFGDYEILVNDNNEITWRRVDTTMDLTFDFIIVPNPSNAQTTVHLSTVVETGAFTIIDAMGRTINSGAISNTDKVNFDASQLQSGVYMVVVTVGNQQMTRRLVVAN